MRHSFRNRSKNSNPRKTISRSYNHPEIKEYKSLSKKSSKKRTSHNLSTNHHVNIDYSLVDNRLIDKLLNLLKSNNPKPTIKNQANIKKVINNFRNNGVFRAGREGVSYLDVSPKKIKKLKQKFENTIFNVVDIREHDSEVKNTSINPIINPYSNNQSQNQKKTHKKSKNKRINYSVVSNQLLNDLINLLQSGKPTTNNQKEINDILYHFNNNGKFITRRTKQDTSFLTTNNNKVKKLKNLYNKKNIIYEVVPNNRENQTLIEYSNNFYANKGGKRNTKTSRKKKKINY